VVNKKTITHLPVPFFVTLTQCLATCAILKVAQWLKVGLGSRQISSVAIARHVTSTRCEPSFPELSGDEASGICPGRHPPHWQPSFLELNGILCRVSSNISISARMTASNACGPAFLE